MAAVKRGISVGEATDLVMSLEGITPGRKYGYPAFLLGSGQFFARFRDHDMVLVLALGSIDDRDVLMQLDPDVFFYTDHYRNYPAVLIRLDAVPKKLFADVVKKAFADVNAQAKSKPRRARRSGIRRRS